MPPVRVALLACAVALVGCGREPPLPRLESIAPAEGYSDRPLRVALRGVHLYPSWRIDIASGERRGETSGFSGRVGTGATMVPLHDFGWRSPNEVSAWLPPGLPPGVHPVEITDGRGQTAFLEPGFEALGPDGDGPQVVFESPVAGAPVGPGMKLPLRLAAWDRDPGRLRRLGWSVQADGMILAEGSCAVETMAQPVRCLAQVALPSSLPVGELLEVSADCEDDAPVPNRAAARLTFLLRPPPRIDEVLPARGGITGGTDLVIHGAGFVPGTRAFLGEEPLIPDGGVVVDESTISGRAPPHLEGRASIVVRTPIGEAFLPEAFAFLPPPQLDGISPTAGHQGGGTPVEIIGRHFTRATRIYFGLTLSAAQSLADAVFVEEAGGAPGLAIKGTAPAGRGLTSVWAVDPELGWSRLPNGFSWTEGP